MKCVEAQEQMAAYVCGQTDPAETRAMAAHLRQCADCRVWHGEVQAAWGDWAAGATAGTASLVAPVLARLPGSRPGSAALPRPAPPRMPLRQALLHYGVAASLAAVLFGAGAFDPAGPGIRWLQDGLAQLLVVAGSLWPGGGL